MPEQQAVKQAVKLPDVQHIKSAKYEHDFMEAVVTGYAVFVYSVEEELDRLFNEEYQIMWGWEKTGWLVSDVKLTDEQLRAELTQYRSRSASARMK